MTTQNNHPDPLAPTSRLTTGAHLWALSLRTFIANYQVLLETLPPETEDSETAAGLNAELAVGHAEGCEHAVAHPSNPPCWQPHQGSPLSAFAATAGAHEPGSEAGMDRRHAP